MFPCNIKLGVGLNQAFTASVLFKGGSQPASISHACLSYLLVQPVPNCVQTKHD